MTGTRTSVTLYMYVPISLGLKEDTKHMHMATPCPHPQRTSAASYGQAKYRLFSFGVNVRT